VIAKATVFNFLVGSYVYE